MVERSPGGNKEWGNGVGKFVKYERAEGGAA